MSETAPQSPPEQMPGQEQLFTEKTVWVPGAEDKDGITEMVPEFQAKDFLGRDMAEGTLGYEHPKPEDEEQQTEATPSEAADAAAGPYKAGETRLAQFFINSAERIDNATEKARRFGRFLGKVGLKSQLAIAKVKEKAGSTKERWSKAGDTTAKRIGHVASGAAVKAARSVGGNVSELRQSNALGRAGYARTQGEMLGRQAASETDELVKAELERKITKLQYKEQKARAGAAVHAARAHKRRTGSAVRVVSSGSSESIPTAKAA